MTEYKLPANFKVGKHVEKEEVLRYVAKKFPTGRGGRGYRANLIVFLKTIVGRPINSNYLLEIPSKNAEKQNYCNRRWEEVYSLDRLPFVNWNHPLGKQAGLPYQHYCLLSCEPMSKPTTGRGVNKRIMTQVFERDRSTCTRCGAVAGHVHPMFPDKMVRLHVGHLVPFVLEDSCKKYTADDFTTLCSMCNEGEKASPLTREQRIASIRNQIATLQEALEREINTGL
jgi:hypothetical protein